MGKENIKVHIVRHGVTAENSRRELQGWRDTPLSEEGRLQIQNILNQFIYKGITTIVSSDLLRASQTASIIGSSTGSARFEVPELRERRYGAWEGRNIDELQKSLGENWGKFTPEGAEGYGEFSTRVLIGFKIALEKVRQGGNLVIVSHGGPIKILRESLGIDKPDASSVGHRIENGSVLTLIGPRDKSIMDFEPI